MTLDDVPSALHLTARDSVFIDFSTSFQFAEDANDPLYPYTPPSLSDSVAQLIATTAPASVRTLILSVPYLPRSAQTDDALAALRSFLSSPACDAVHTVKICGSCHLLNDRWTLDVLKRRFGRDGDSEKCMEELILQADGDSYAMAAVLAAFEGVKKLRCTLGQVHASFKEETLRTMEQLEELDIEVTGDAFQPRSLTALRSLRVTFDDWDGQGGSLSEALAGADLDSLALSRRACPMVKRRDPPSNAFDPYTRATKPVYSSPTKLLSGLSTLGHLEIASGSLNEPLALGMDLLDSIPASVSSLSFRNIAMPLKLLTELRHRVPFSYPNLECLRVDLYLQAQEGWSFILGLLADDLEQMGVAHHLILRSELKKEERAFGMVSPRA